MNHCLTDWNTEGGNSVARQKKRFEVDQDLVELLWHDGDVVLQSQKHTNKKVGFDDSYERRPLLIHEHDDHPMMRRGGGNPSNLVQENENVSSWLHNSGSIDDDPFEKEFCSSFTSSDFHSSNLIQTNTPFEQNKITKFPTLLPPPGYFPSSTKMMAQIKNNGTIPPSNGELKAKAKGGAPQAVVAQKNKECSVMTVGSSHCGSNQLAMNSKIAIRGKEYEDVGKTSPQSEKDMVEKAANTSSSGGSGSSSGGRTTYNQSTTTNSHKRKERDDPEDSESPSEAAGNNKSAQRSGSTRRSRAAEVHNLSERRRRDRINEKMKALQELIPHSNKSDKASMLDEAIEYMKSLQMQLQMLWMGSGMAASMMFPSMQQHYLSRMRMSAAAMGSPPTLPSLQQLHNPMQQQHLPRMPQLDQTMVTPSPPTQNQASLIDPVNYYNQFNTPSFSDQYAAFLGFQQLQNATQPMNMFNFGSHAAQPNSNMAPTNHCKGPSVDEFLFKK